MLGNFFLTIKWFENDLNSVGSRNKMNFTFQKKFVSIASKKQSSNGG